MSFEQVKDFYQKLATDANFRHQILEDLRTDDELKELTEEDLKAIFGGDHPGMGPYDPDSDASRPIPIDGIFDPSMGLIYGGPRNYGHDVPLWS